MGQSNEKVNELYKTDQFKQLLKFKTNIEEQCQINLNLEKEYENELFMEEEYEKVSQNDKYQLEIQQKYLKYEKNAEIVNPTRIYEETSDFMKKLKDIEKNDIIYIQNQLPNYSSFCNSIGPWGQSFMVFNAKKKIFTQFFSYCNENSFRRHLEQAKMFQHEFQNILAVPKVQYNQYSQIIIYERSCMDLQYFLKIKKSKQQKQDSEDKNKPVITLQEFIYLMYFMVENFIKLFDKNIIFSDIKLNNFQLENYVDEKNKEFKNKYIIKFVPDQMGQYYEDIDFYFPQKYTPFNYNPDILEIANKRKLEKNEIFQSQLFQIGRCLQKCVDPNLETRKGYKSEEERFEDFINIYEKNFLGEHLAQVLRNMEGLNPEKMTEYYEHFEIVTKDITYATHYLGIYSSKFLDDEELQIIPNFHESIIKNANTAKILKKKKSEKLIQFSLKQLQEEIQFYGQFCLYQQQQKSIECLIDHYDELLDQLPDNKENEQKRSDLQNKIADTYQALALNLQKQQKPEESLEYYKDCLDLKEAIYGKNSIYLYDTLMAIGKMSYEENMLDDAEDKFKRALHLMQDQYSEKHYQTSIPYAKLGKTMQKAKKYQDSIYYFLEGLDNKSSFFGENHVQLSQDLNNIGLVYEEQGNYHKALKVFNKSLHILENHFGKNHPELTKTITNLANVYNLLGKDVESLNLIQRNLQITQNFYGEDHVANGRHEFALGILYRQYDRIEEAIEYLKRAEQKYIKYYGIEHKNYIKIYKELTNCEKDLKQEETFD